MLVHTDANPKNETMIIKFMKQLVDVGVPIREATGKALKAIELVQQLAPVREQIVLRTIGLAAAQWS